MNVSSIARTEPPSTATMTRPPRRQLAGNRAMSIHPTRAAANGVGKRPKSRMLTYVAFG